MCCKVTCAYAHLLPDPVLQALDEIRLVWQQLGRKALVDAHNTQPLNIVRCTARRCCAYGKGAG